MSRVLIVDDLPQNLYYLEVLLNTHGYEVNKAANGIEALEIAQKTPPDVVISDILMPGMDGFNLCRKWKANVNLQTIPFIFYTATYTDPRDEKLALDLGAERFLTKPMEAEELLGVLQSVLEKTKISQPEPQKTLAEDQTVFYKEYNEALVRKLEDKMLELSKSNHRLVSLYKASSNLHSYGSSQELIHLVQKILGELDERQQSVYYSVNDENREFILEAVSGFSEEIVEALKTNPVIRMKEEKNPVVQAGLSQEVVNVGDASSEKNWVSFDSSIRSALFIPVAYERVLFGVIGVFSAQADAFLADDEMNLSILANNLAVALANNKNQQKVLKQLTRISTLHDIDSAISNSQDLSSILAIFLDHLVNQLQIDAADIIIIGSNDGKLAYFSGRGFKTNLISTERMQESKSLSHRVITTKKAVEIYGSPDVEVSPQFKSFWQEEEFSFYIGLPLIARGITIGVLEIYHRTPFSPNSEWKDFLITMAGQAGIAIENCKLFNDLGESHANLLMAYNSTIDSLSRIIDLREMNSEEHTRKFIDLFIRFTKVLEISKERTAHIYRGALLHDIGMLRIPESILLKPGALLDDEWEVVKQHPQYAYDLLSAVDFLKPALDIPFSHHERWDGTGYPRGLKGEDIPKEVRAFTLVDVWDALSSDRPFRKAWPRNKIITYLREQSGKIFDPNLVEPFILLVQQGTN